MYDQSRRRLLRCCYGAAGVAKVLTQRSYGSSSGWLSVVMILEVVAMVYVDMLPLLCKHFTCPP